MTPERPRPDSIVANLSEAVAPGRCAWLNHLHRNLDRAALEAYGWSDLAEFLFATGDRLRASNPRGQELLW